MQRIDSAFTLRRVRPVLSPYFLLILAASVLFFASGLAQAQSGDKAKTADQSASAFVPDATIVDIMKAMVAPAADKLWNAVAITSTPDGIVKHVPTTDEDWDKLRFAAITLAESANNLIIRGRTVDKLAPGAKPTGDLTPEQIHALIEKNWAGWVGYAHVMHAAAMEALKPIEARDIDALMDVGGTIDVACMSCHERFWYPQQQ